MLLTTINAWNVSENLSLNRKLILDGFLVHIQCCVQILNLLVQDRISKSKGIIFLTNMLTTAKQCSFVIRDLCTTLHKKSPILSGHLQCHTHLKTWLEGEELPCSQNIHLFYSNISIKLFTTCLCQILSTNNKSFTSLILNKIRS